MNFAKTTEYECLHVINNNAAIEKYILQNAQGFALSYEEKTIHAFEVLPELFYSLHLNDFISKEIFETINNNKISDILYQASEQKDMFNVEISLGIKFQNLEEYFFSELYHFLENHKNIKKIYSSDKTKILVYTFSDNLLRFLERMEIISSEKLQELKTKNYIEITFEREEIAENELSDEASLYEAKKEEKPLPKNRKIIETVIPIYIRNKTVDKAFPQTFKLEVVFEKEIGSLVLIKAWVKHEESNLVEDHSDFYKTLDFFIQLNKEKILESDLDRMFLEFNLDQDPLESLAASMIHWSHRSNGKQYKKELAENIDIIQSSLSGDLESLILFKQKCMELGSSEEN